MQAKAVETKHTKTRNPIKGSPPGDLYPGPPSEKNLPDGASVERDSEGRITRIIDAANNATTYSYDQHGQLSQVSSPDAGPVGFTCDANGRVLMRTDAIGNASIYSHDALGRLTGISRPDTAQNLKLSYEAGSPRPARMSDASGDYRYHYDQSGNLLSLRAALNGVVYETAYTYDPRGRLSSMRYPTGRVLHYVRDLAGRITAIADGGQDLLLGHINRLPDGRIHSFEQGNRLKTVREYGQDGRLTSIKVGGVMHQEYERDHDGRIIRITDRISPELSQSFAYDKEGRLIKAQAAGWPGRAWGRAKRCAMNTTAWASECLRLIQARQLYITMIA
jgi:YD repeat-containing protein